MNTLPTKWYIGVTEENRDELDRWRQRVATSHRDNELRAHHHTILSRHIYDGSCYYANPVKYVREHDDYQDYEEITIEQFREITNSNKIKHPEKWYIPVTEENIDELNRWRLSKRPAKVKHWDSLFVPDAMLLSKHPTDSSYFWCGSKSDFSESCPSHQKITLEQFRQIANSTPNQKPMTKSIQISRDLLNEYYDAATNPQREYLTEHFKLDGTTTDEAIRGLHEMACSKWQPRIRKNHPECFPEDSKYFDFSAYVRARGNCGIVKDDVAKSLGLSNDFIQIRGAGSANENRSFFLTPEYDWELVQDGFAKVLIPTKKQS